MNISGSFLYADLTQQLVSATQLFTAAVKVESPDLFFNYAKQNLPLDELTFAMDIDVNLQVDPYNDQKTLNAYVNIIWQEIHSSITDQFDRVRHGKQSIVNIDKVIQQPLIGTLYPYFIYYCPQITHEYDTDEKSITLFLEKLRNVIDAFERIYRDHESAVTDKSLKNYADELLRTIYRNDQEQVYTLAKGVLSALREENQWNGLECRKFLETLSRQSQNECFHRKEMTFREGVYSFNASQAAHLPQICRTLIVEIRNAEKAALSSEHRAGLNFNTEKASKVLFFYVIKALFEKDIISRRVFKKNVLDTEGEQGSIKKIDKFKKIQLNNKRGKKTALYEVIRQLYLSNVILNTLPEIAQFLIEHVTGFEQTSINTITTELGRTTDPLKKMEISIPTSLIMNVQY